MKSGTDGARVSERFDRPVGGEAGGEHGAKLHVKTGGAHEGEVQLSWVSTGAVASVVVASVVVVSVVLSLMNE